MGSFARTTVGLLAFAIAGVCLVIAALGAVHIEGRVQEQDPRPGPESEDERSEREAADAAASFLLVLLREEHLQVPAREDRRDIRIVVVGEGRFGRALAALAKKVGKTKKSELRIVVETIPEDQLIEESETLEGADIVAFATDDLRVHRQVIAACKKQRTMLVSRRPEFIREGGHLELYVNKKGKLGFELDHRTLVREKGFQVSSAVVRLSHPAEEERR
jgi:hypothetical protein